MFDDASELIVVSVWCLCGVCAGTSPPHLLTPLFLHTVCVVSLDLQNDLASNENKFRISQITQSFLGAIFNSVDDIPEDVRRVCVW